MERQRRKRIPRIKESKCINYFDDPYKALKNTDALIILTEWAEFMSPDFSKIKNSLIEPVIFDGRNLYEIGIMRNKGFHYESKEPLLT